MFRLAERPALMPGQTLIGSTVGPVVDTGTTLRNGGRVYLSKIEVGEAAKLFPEVVATLAKDFGWASPEDVQNLRDVVAELRAQVESLEEAQPKVLSLEDAMKLAEGAHVQPRAAA
jgi:hypothetical protein